MVRVSGVDLPSNKVILISLTYIKGIGKKTSSSILESCNINPFKRTNDLTDNESNILASYVENNYTTEGKLTIETSYDIKRLISINSYRGFRHKVCLPVRGQSTQSNAKTAKKMKKRGARHFIK